MTQLCHGRNVYDLSDDSQSNFNDNEWNKLRDQLETLNLPRTTGRHVARATLIIYACSSQSLCMQQVMHDGTVTHHDITFNASTASSLLLLFPLLSMHSSHILKSNRGSWKVVRRVLYIVLSSIDGTCSVNSTTQPAIHDDFYYSLLNIGHSS